MEFEHKTKIIEELVRDFFSDPEMYEEEAMSDFFVYNDLGIPLAQGHVYGLIDTFSEEGFNVVNETWLQLCNILDADPDGDYESLDDVMLYGDEDL